MKAVEPVDIRRFDEFIDEDQEIDLAGRFTSSINPLVQQSVHECWKVCELEHLNAKLLPLV